MLKSINCFNILLILKSINRLFEVIIISCNVPGRIILKTMHIWWQKVRTYVEKFDAEIVDTFRDIKLNCSEKLFAKILE